MHIKVLGPGCAKCKKLEKMTKELVAEKGIDAEIEKVEDIFKIMQFGVMSTPGLVINEKVVLSGRLPSTSELSEILTNNQ